MIRGEKKSLSQNDLAKYSFLREAAERMEMLDLKIGELEDPDFDLMLDRAESRIKEAINEGVVSTHLRMPEVEILSFPIAVMMVASAADNRLKRRYALAEAKRVSSLLKDESKEKILEIAHRFNWRIRVSKNNSSYFFQIHFADFLKQSTFIREGRWKLVNRILSNGEVFLTKRDAARLLEEEVRKHIERRLDLEVGSLPQNIANRVDMILKLFDEHRGKIRSEEIPNEVVIEAFPPCIKSLYDASLSGNRVSHVGRFALTSFLLNIGMNLDDVVNMFRSLTDFNEKMTRYQVEHIAGVRGSRTKYTPPQCDTLITHGICPEISEICRTIRHPLRYYLRRLREMRTQGGMVEKNEV